MEETFLSSNSTPESLAIHLQPDEIVTCYHSSASCADPRRAVILAGTNHGYMRRVDTPTATGQLRHHDARVVSIWCIDDVIVSASADSTVKLWNMKLNKLYGKFTCPHPITSMVCVPNGSAPSSGSQKAPITILAGDRLGNVHALNYHFAASSA